MNALLEAVSDAYGFGPVVLLEKVTKGFLSENFILSAGDEKYFLKKYRFDSAQKVSEIHAVKSFFVDGGIPAICPLQTRDGNTYMAHHGRFYALFPFVVGHQYERGNLSDTAVVSMARTLAEMHLRGRHYALSVDEVVKGWDKKHCLKEIDTLFEKIPLGGDQEGFDALALKTLSLKKTLVEANELIPESFDAVPQHLLHGDFHDHNIFFDTEGQVTHVFDFEKTGYGPRSHELYRSLSYSLLGSEIDETCLTQLRLYLRSYLQVYPMQKEELEQGFQAYYLRAIHSLWIESEHYMRNNTRVDSLLANEYRRLVFLSENFERMRRMVVGVFVT